MFTLFHLWDRLHRVRSLSFFASSGGSTGWDGRGVSTVEVREPGDGLMTWHEEGSWRPTGGERDIRFTNVYRWTLAGERPRLEHLRFGEANAVLFDMAQAGEREWRPVSPHLCREDCYSAVLLVGSERL